MTGRLLPASKFSRLAKSTYVPDSMLSTDATPVLLKNSGCEKKSSIYYMAKLFVLWNLCLLIIIVLIAGFHLSVTLLDFFFLLFSVR